MMNEKNRPDTACFAELERFFEFPRQSYFISY